MISTVLVPLDGSVMAEAALPYARAIVPSDGKLVLLRVLPEFDPLLTELLGMLEEEIAAEGKTEIDAAQEALAQVAARMAGAGPRPETEVRRGDPASQVLQAIAQDRIDLAAMTTHGRDTLGRATYGSVADRVARQSSVPVLLVRPDGVGEETPAIRRLLVPLDGSPLAEGALPVASELAKRLAVPVHLVQAIDLASALASLSGEGIFAVAPPAEVYNQWTEALQRGARETLQEAAARLQSENVDATWEVLSGSPYVTIATASEPGDIIIMTSHGRGGIMRWLLGSVAEKLVREAPVPVLLVPAANRGMEAPGG